MVQSSSPPPSSGESEVQEMGSCIRTPFRKKQRATLTHSFRSLRIFKCTPIRVGRCCQHHWNLSRTLGRTAVPPARLQHAELIFGGDENCVFKLLNGSPLKEVWILEQAAGLFCEHCLCVGVWDQELRLLVSTLYCPLNR